MEEVGHTVLSGESRSVEIIGDLVIAVISRESNDYHAGFATLHIWNWQTAAYSLVSIDCLQHSVSDDLVACT